VRDLHIARVATAEWNRDRLRRLQFERLFSQLPKILIPAVATGKLGFADQNHVLNVFTGRMLTPARTRDTAVLEMAARPALSLHHQITPASPESEMGAFVRGEIPRIPPEVPCSHWSPTNASGSDCSMAFRTRQMYVHANSPAIFSPERAFYGFCQAVNCDP
jgi:hypothetical protein